MTWIKTVPIAEASDRLRELMMKAVVASPVAQPG